MDTDLSAIKAALAKLSDRELLKLTDTTYKVMQKVPGLFAWVKAACDRELNRRGDFNYDLRPPDAAIPDEEDARSIDAAIAMRATFAKEAPAVHGLFDELVKLLTGEGRRKN